MGRHVILRCWFVLSFGLLQLHACVVTQDGDQTTYSISDVPRVSNDKASSCEYSWANRSAHVFANNKDAVPGLVMKNSIDTVITSKCIDEVIYKQSCLSEVEPYTTTCMCSCSRKSPVEQDKNSTPSWIVALRGGGGVVVGVVVSVILLVLVLVLGLLSKFRNKILSCSQLGCIYTPVETEASEAADVEMGDV